MYTNIATLVEARPAELRKREREYMYIRIVYIRVYTYVCTYVCEHRNSSRGETGRVA